MIFDPKATFLSLLHVDEVAKPAALCGLSPRAFIIDAINAIYDFKSMCLFGFLVARNNAVN